MRRIFAPYAVAVIVLASSAAIAQSPKFLTALDDVPLLPGLEERVDSLAEIDGPEGRIVSVQAGGPVTGPAVSAFYDASLPKLGWRREGAVFTRDRQRLSVTFRREGDAVIVTYRLIERPASLRLD